MSNTSTGLQHPHAVAPGGPAARIGAVLVHPWTMRGTAIAFVLVAVFMAFALKYPIVDGNGNVPYYNTIAPDEHRHIANILFYAGRSVWDGPIITHVPTRDLAMGEVLRFPSYFYYYAMSFPAKVVLHLGLPYSVLVVSLRLVSVVLGVIGLYVTRRLLHVMGVPDAVTMAVVIVFAFTGRYVWQSAAISYDAPAMTLFLLCLLACARLIREPGPAPLVAAVVWGVWSIDLKYTFVPFVLVAVLVAVVLVLQRGGLSHFHGMAAGAVRVLRERTVRTVGVVVAAVVGLAVLVERLGVNVLVYHQVNPDCDKLHTHQQCLTFDIYSRNYSAERAHDLAVVQGQAQQPFDLLEFAGRWVTTYLQSIFFYRDRNSDWQLPTVVALLGTIALVVAAVAIVLSIRSLLRTRTFVWAAAVAGTYLVAMFVFNVRTYLRLDSDYAFSGRYLLPVLPLLYAFVALALIALWRSFAPSWRRLLVVPALVVLLATVLTYNAPVAFLAYARNATWYTNTAQRLLPHFLTTGGTADGSSSDPGAGP